MQTAQTSFRKTVWLAFGAALALTGLLGLALATLPGRLPALFATSVLAALGSVLLMALGVLIAGLVVSYRAARNERGEPDLFDARNQPRSEASIAMAGHDSGWLRWTRPLRRLFGTPPLQVGDEVRIRSPAEIRTTLDAQGCLDGLPFMPEMLPFCGQAGRVFRVVDKVYDYGGRKNLRRMRNVVTLAGLRCNGGGHDGCQAGCSLMWHLAWLQPAARSAALPPAGLQDELPIHWSRAASRAGESPRYTCQYTQIVAASMPMSPRDPRQDLYPWVAGNVAWTALLVALLTRWFNRIQSLRGGATYPARPPSTGDSSPRIDRGLQVGECVVVQDAAAIASTLDRSGRNRGLWFDRDMLKHCRRQYRIAARVEHLIDDATGLMRTMKTPCLVLEGVTTSGEFLRFCPQHDLPLWREAWLQRAASPAAPTPEAAR